jgi:hypothetical protein
MSDPTPALRLKGVGRFFFVQIRSGTLKNRDHAFKEGNDEQPATGLQGQKDSLGPLPPSDPFKFRVVLARKQAPERL